MKLGDISKIVINKIVLFVVFKFKLKTEFNYNELNTMLYVSKEKIPHNSEKILQKNNFLFTFYIGSEKFVEIDWFLFEI